MEYELKVCPLYREGDYKHLPEALIELVLHNPEDKFRNVGLVLGLRSKARTNLVIRFDDNRELLDGGMVIFRT